LLLVDCFFVCLSVSENNVGWTSDYVSELSRTEKDHCVKQHSGGVGGEKREEKSVARRKKKERKKEI